MRRNDRPPSPAHIMAPVGRRRAISLSLLVALPSGRADDSIGQLATQGRYPASCLAGARSLLSRVQHFARDEMSKAQFLYMNCFGSDEGGPGEAARLTVHIEYPAGRFTPLTFAGATDGVISNGGELLSDGLPVTIPSGAGFREWVRYENPAGVLFSTTNPAADAACLNPPAIDVTRMLVEVAPSQMAYGATAILGVTRRPSVLVVGDSRAAGAIGGRSGNDGGNVTPSFSPELGYINVAVPGERIWQQLTSFKKRGALAAYCSHVIVASGINDLSGTEAGTVIRTLVQLVASFDRPVFVATVEPQASGRFSDPEGTDQLPDPVVEPRRLAYNRALRAGLPGVGAVLDIARVAELTPDVGKWKAGLTEDGVHGNSRFAELVIQSGVISPEMFRRT